MNFDKLPESFLPHQEVKRIIEQQISNNSFSNLLTVSPQFFDILANLDYPNDLWVVRDIVYNQGKSFIAKDKMIKDLIDLLSKEIMVDIYAELKGVNSAVELTKRFNAIVAETNCAKRLKSIGAINIQKRVTPEDIACIFDGKEYGFQVKSKANEDFPEHNIEEALVGEMHDPGSRVLRKYSFISFYRCAKVGGGFLRDLIKYIHSNLEHDMENGSGKFVNQNLSASLSCDDNEFYLDVTGLDKYAGADVSIVFRFNKSKYIGNAKAAFDQKPQERLWQIISDKIVTINTKESLIGWLEIDVSFQYETYLLSDESKADLSNFLNSHFIPLIAIIRGQFDPKARIFALNNAALALPFVTDENFLN